MDLTIRGKTWKLEEHPNEDQRDRYVKLTTPGGPHRPIVIYVPKELIDDGALATAGLL